MGPTQWSVSLLCLGLALRLPLSSGGETVGLLYDTEFGREMAAAVRASDPALVAPPVTSSCPEQLTALRASGVERFISLCQRSRPLRTRGAERVVRPAEGACAPAQMALVLQLRALQRYMHTERLSTVVTFNPRDFNTVLSALSSHKVNVVLISTAEDLRTKVPAPDRSVVYVADLATLRSAPPTVRTSGFTHWFVPDISDQTDLVADEIPQYDMLFNTRFLTAMVDVGSGGRSEEHKSRDVTLTEVFDAVATVRKSINSVNDLCSHDPDTTVTLLAYRWRDADSDQVPPVLDAAHPGRWIPLARVRNGSLSPSVVHSVAPYRLVSQASVDSGCDLGQVKVTGQDPVTGAGFVRQFNARSVPRLLLVHGGELFSVAVTCPRAQVLLTCQYPGQKDFTCRKSFHGQGNIEGDPQPGQERSLRKKRFAGSETHYVHDGRVWRRAGRRVPAGSAPGGYPHYYSFHQRPAGTTLAQYFTQAGTNRREDVHSSYTSYQQPDSNSYDENNSYNYYNNTDDNKENSDDSEELRLDFLPVLPSVFGCGGAITGCSFCFVFLSSINSTVRPTACFGSCSLGVSTNCATVIGNTFKEILDPSLSR